MIGKFGQIQYRIIEGQLNVGNIIEKNYIEKEKPLSLPSNEQFSKSNLEGIISKEMRRLSIKYFKGREYKSNEISNLIDGYINDMENFVRNKFPDYKFFLYVIAQGKNWNAFWISNRHIFFTETDGNISEIYEDKMLCYSYLMYIKRKNISSENSLTDFENYIKPKMKKTISTYLFKRKYDHEEFGDYINGMGDEFVREIRNYSTKICSKIIIIFLKKPVCVYSFTWKWLSGNNTNYFYEKYDGEYTRCLGIIGSCFP